MTSLMTLPRELRDLIIHYVITQPTRCPPLSPSEDPTRDQRAEARDTSCLSWTRGLGIEYQTDPSCYYSNVHGLLLTNRELYAQTKHHVGLMKAAGEVKYVLDVMVVGNGEFRPTWTYIPFLTKRIDRLEVRFRIFYHCEEEGPLFESMDSRTSNGWAVYSLIERFVALGPKRPGENMLLTDAGVRSMVDKVGIGVLAFSVDEMRIAWDANDEATWPRGWYGFGHYLIRRLYDMTRVRPLTAVYATIFYEFIGEIETQGMDEETQTHNFDIWWEVQLHQVNSPFDPQTPNYGLIVGGKRKFMIFEDWMRVILGIREQKGFPPSKYEEAGLKFVVVE